MHDDAQLLRQYAETGSEPAFRELVERHIQLVNSTARRMVNGDAHLAQDVTQLVFTDLARKAATLPNDIVLGGWLHRHTCYTALKAIRTESRRRTRERTAMELNAVNDSTGADAHWAQLAPVLDDALNRLDAPDRDAIVLRFLQQQDLRSIGQALGLSEDTAQKRVSRALEKLRGLLTNRGVAVSSATLLATSLEAAPFTPIPSTLAAAVSAHALSTATMVSTGLTLATLKTMITSKLALGLAATIAVVGATTAIISHQNTDTSTPATPAVSAATAAAPSIKIISPQVAHAAQVEAPKLAPAPAGNKPATPDDLAASAAANAPVVLTGFAQVGTLSFNGSPINARRAIALGSNGGSLTVGSGTVVLQAVGGDMGATGMSTGSGGPMGSVSRQVSIANGQMTVTTTKDGVTTTTTSPAPPPGAVITGPSDGDSNTMTIVDQNGVSHTVEVPMAGSTGSTAVMITTSPDGTNNVLQVTPATPNP